MISSLHIELVGVLGQVTGHVTSGHQACSNSDVEREGTATEKWWTFHENQHTPHHNTTPISAHLHASATSSLPGNKLVYMWPLQWLVILV